jgi:hypothetical protein
MSRMGAMAQRGRQLSTLAGLALLVTLLTVLSPHFLTVSNLSNVLEQTSINAVIAVGMTFVILSGGIDLSVARWSRCPGWPWRVRCARGPRCRWPCSPAWPPAPRPASRTAC